MQQFSASSMRCDAMRCAAAFMPPSASTYLLLCLFSLDRSGIHCLIGIAHHLALVLGVVVVVPFYLLCLMLPQLSTQCLAYPPLQCSLTGCPFIAASSVLLPLPY
ncbi:hypothetical protein FOIG_13142 [Fusarium odoratissimum NRRL 54006]|uniref:Uncharacterized protein n=2 Tax=Fusarium oxysporum species complex TaxID=171631 RepID=X0KA49_FUSO5|nr:uncharacterized protein FOIG_13142 [Fusarium odoratissimum NRRL 54006]EXL93854.1 hypothetical protein FOIG_13142 [Fusarium odoratissimum NRRL 54006]TXC03768.1 hypothetical protein FocTR4_00000540 [Fusarium oxysporum f. sp. cubense]